MIQTASNDLTVSFFPVFFREDVDLRGRRKMMRPGANMGMMSLFVGIFFFFFFLVGGGGGGGGATEEVSGKGGGTKEE